MWWLIATPFVLARNWLLPFLDAHSADLLRQNLRVTAMGAAANQMDAGVFWALLLGVLSLGLLTRRGELMALLAGPVRRQDVYVIHACLTGGGLILGQLVVACYLCGLDALVGLPAHPALLVHVLVKRLLLYLAAWSVGLAAGATISNVVMAVIAACGVSAFPVYVALLAEYLGAKWLGIPPAHLYQAIAQLSPFSLLDQVTGASLAGYALWFVAWILGWTWLGFRLFQRLPLEHLSEAFPFEAYRSLLFLGIALCASLVITVWVDHVVDLGQTRTAAVEAFVIWLAATCGLLAALTFGRRRRSRRWKA